MDLPGFRHLKADFRKFNPKKRKRNVVFPLEQKILGGLRMFFLFKKPWKNLAQSWHKVNSESGIILGIADKNRWCLFCLYRKREVKKMRTR